MTIAQINARPEVCSRTGVSIDSRVPKGDCYRVLIYLDDGWVADDGTSTLYGATVREAAKGLKYVRRGTPE